MPAYIQIGLVVLAYIVTCILTIDRAKRSAEENKERIIELSEQVNKHMTDDEPHDNCKVETKMLQSLTKQFEESARRFEQTAGHLTEKFEAIQDNLHKHVANSAIHMDPIRDPEWRNDIRKSLERIESKLGAGTK